MPSMADELSARWRVAEGQDPGLAAIDPAEPAGAPGDKDQTKAASAELREELIDLQARLFAESKRSLLLVLQAMDAGGKDGTIRSVLSGVNPQGCRIQSFGVPSEEELAHDFLWRIHRAAPRQGEVVVFNRSHYEDVLVVRVHELVPEDVWRGRYRQIRDFEDALSAAGTQVVKCMLHISKEEQADRLRERLEDPTKRWKFRAGDLEERKLWDDYMVAFSEALSETSTSRAPWFVIPADRNWYRDWAVLTLLVETLRAMDPQFPPAEEGLDSLLVE